MKGTNSNNVEKKFYRQIEYFFRLECPVDHSECVTLDQIASCECKEGFHGNGTDSCVPDGFTEEANENDKVGPGYFFGPDGGFILVSRRYRVGLDFDITMQIKPSNISGLILAIQGRKDYMILQMVNGTMTFQVDNGRGPITAIFKPESPFQLCDGNWHEVHAEKAKNVVTLSVDNVFPAYGIGVPGVSSTDTMDTDGLFIGGHPRADRLTGLKTSNGYIGCIKNISIKSEQLEIKARMLKGDIQSNVCPTI